MGAVNPLVWSIHRATYIQEITVMYINVLWKYILLTYYHVHDLTQKHKRKSARKFSVTEVPPFPESSKKP